MAELPRACESAPLSSRRAASDERIVTLLRMGKLITAEGETLCRVRNLSQNGLMAECFVPLSKGDGVAIELKRDAVCAGEVRWALEGRIGVALAAPVDLHDLLARDRSGPGGRAQPWAPNFAIDCPAVLRFDIGRVPAQISHIWQGGARIAAALPAHCEGLMTLAIPGLRDCEGGIVPAGEGGIDFAFTAPLAFAELGQWLAGRKWAA